MELIQMPRQMRNRGFIGWPQMYRVGRREELPPVGVSYLIAEEIDFALIFRLMIPTLIKQHGYFNWPEVYQGLTGKPYCEQRVYRRVVLEDAIPGDGESYLESDIGTETMSLEDLASDEATYVDMDILCELTMVPAFMTDIRDAITVNVTNNYAWQDGYNKKTGVCAGYLTEQPRSRSLVILDISSSIPDGVSAGMMTLIKTITEITNADLILTAGQSYFYARDEVKAMDIHRERARIARSNESMMFREILRSHDMDYENVITFGDSDNPGEIRLEQKIHTKRWYSFYTMACDTYGHSYECGCGYGRWVSENNHAVLVIHNTDWARFFTKRSPQQSW